MCFTEKQQKQQFHKIQWREIQNPFIQGCWKAERTERRGNGTGGKTKYSNQSRHRGWQMLENSYRKTCGPFRLMMVLKIHTLVSRKILPYTHQRQKFQFFKEGNMQRTLGSTGPTLPGRRRRTEQRAATASLRSHPSPLGVTQGPAAACSLAGDGCGEGNFSAEVELLSADCR